MEDITTKVRYVLIPKPVNRGRPLGHQAMWRVRGVRELTPTGTLPRPRTRRQSSAQLHVFTATMITTTISFDDSVLALASSAEAVLDTFTVAGTGGSPRVAGIWNEVKSDMEKLLPGAIVRLRERGRGAKIRLDSTSGALSCGMGVHQPRSPRPSASCFTHGNWAPTRHASSSRTLTCSH